MRFISGWNNFLKKLNVVSSKFILEVYELDLKISIFTSTFSPLKTIRTAMSSCLVYPCNTTREFPRGRSALPDVFDEN